MYLEWTTLFLFDGLTEDEVTACLQTAQVCTEIYEKGAVIYDASHAQRALAVVEQGRARVTHGRVVMNDLTAGDVFGAAALYGSDEPYPSSVVALTPCRITFIPQETVTRWMAQMPRVGENYVRFLSDRIRFLNRRLSTLTAGPADDKLWRYLLAHRDADGRVTLAGGMTELAERLDMGRSSLYRSFDQLTASGRIRREGKHTILLTLEE